MGNWYCSREDVKEALDIKYSARMDRVIDRAIESASRSVENMTRRVFYPTTAVKYFDYPDRVTSYAYRQWIDQPDQLIAVTSIVSGGNTLASNEYFLEPVNSGPPYNRIEINLGLDETFDADNTWQRQTVVTGKWGYQENWDTATTITASINSSVTTVAIDDSAAVGVGDLIRLGTEWMSVTAKAMVDTGDGVTLTADKNSVTLTGLTAGNLNVNETILVDSERMLVVDTAGTTATVVRAYDGTVLAAHTTASVFAPRSLTVVRGANGSTAASHTSGDAVERFAYPGPVRQLAIAEALVTIAQGQAGYGRTVGAGDNVKESSGKGLYDLRSEVKLSYGRRSRLAAV